MLEDTERICPTCGYQPMDGLDGFRVKMGPKGRALWETC